MGSGQRFYGSESVFRGKVGIPDDHLDALVAHKLLPRPDVNSGHNKAAGERVPQAMSSTL